jgi:hypothetical protein
MNRRLVLVVVLVLVLDSRACLRGRGRAGGRSGSWSQCMRQCGRRLSMNRTSSACGSLRKRRRAAALQDAGALAKVTRTAGRFWSAPPLRRFGISREVHGPNSCGKANQGSPRTAPAAPGPSQTPGRGWCPHCELASAPGVVDSTNFRIALAVGSSS